MLDDIRKRLLSGFGAVLLTKEKMEEVTERLVEEAKISKQDAQKVVNELFEIGTSRWSEFEENIASFISSGLDKLEVAGKEDVSELKSRIKELEKKLEELEKTSKSGE